MNVYLVSESFCGDPHNAVVVCRTHKQAEEAIAKRKAALIAEREDEWDLGEFVCDWREELTKAGVPEAVAADLYPTDARISEERDSWEKEILEPYRYHIGRIPMTG